MKNYFIFSSKYKKERNAIENKMGKEFVLGNVTVNGAKSEYVMRTTDPDKFTKSYNDSRIVCTVDNLSTVKFTEPTTQRKR